MTDMAKAFIVLKKAGACNGNEWMARPVVSDRRTFGRIANLLISSRGKEEDCQQ